MNWRYFSALLRRAGTHFPARNACARRAFVLRALTAASTLAWCFDAQIIYAQQTISIRVRAQSTVERDQLTLGDIAEVSAKESPELANKLRAVTLGFAPMVGAVREISREKILLAVAAANIQPDEFQLQAPAVVRVRRAAQAIDRAALTLAVEGQLLARLRAEGVSSARLGRVEIPTDVEIPLGQNTEYRVAAGSLTAARDLFAPLTLSVEVLIERRVVRRVPIGVAVEATARVAVARADLAPNVRLRADDVAFEERPIEMAPARYVRDAARLRGASLRRAAARGQALAVDQLQAEIVVKPGDRVRIVGESAQLQIAVTGEARAAGRVGDRIQVKNNQSGATLQATVSDEGEVRVRF